MERPTGPVALSGTLRALGALGVAVVFLCACGTTRHTPLAPSPLSYRPTATGQPVPVGSGKREAVACGSPIFCVAVGQAGANPKVTVVNISTDAGRKWRTESIPVTGPTDLDAIACPGPRTCIAVGAESTTGPFAGAVLVTTDAGRDWQAAVPPSGSTGLSAVTCTATENCLVIATNGNADWSAQTTDFGQIWQRGGTLTSGVGGVSSVTCPIIGHCLTVGFESTAPGQGVGMVDETVNGGTTWTPGKVPTGVGLLHGVTCTSMTHCLAVGTASTATTAIEQLPANAVTSSDGGATWAPATAPKGIDDVWSVFCRALCISVGIHWSTPSPGQAPAPEGGASMSRNAGNTWAAANVHYIPTALTSVVCPTARSCVAVGGDVLSRIAIPLPPPPRPSQTPTQTAL